MGFNPQIPGLNDANRRAEILAQRDLSKLQTQVDGEAVTLAEIVAMQQNEYLHRTAGNAFITSSASFVDVAVVVSAPDFTKVRDDTSLMVTHLASCYFSATNMAAIWGVQIGSTDYGTVQISNNDSLVHDAVTGFVEVTGLAAGTYTVKNRAYRFSGAGNVSCDSNDPLHIHIREVLR